MAFWDGEDTSGVMFMSTDMTTGRESHSIGGGWAGRLPQTVVSFIFISFSYSYDKEFELLMIMKLLRCRSREGGKVYLGTLGVSSNYTLRQTIKIQKSKRYNSKTRRISKNNKDKYECSNLRSGIGALRSAAVRSPSNTRWFFFFPP